MQTKIFTDKDLAECRMLSMLLENKHFSLCGIKAETYIKVTRDEKNRCFMFEYE